MKDGAVMRGKVNRKIVLARYPSGLPVEGDFRMEQETLAVPFAGQLLIRHEILGLAPAARLRMSTSASYAAPMAIGDVVYGQAVGTVMQSRHPGFAAGDRVMTMEGGWQDYSVSDGAKLWPIDSRIASPSVWLGALGTSGMTAWVGFRKVGRPRQGETVVVSAATGGVGSTAGQLAAVWGARVVGVAGGAAKCSHAVRELGMAACVDYRDPRFDQALAAACPDGIDVYFDNVGGAVRDAAWPLMNRNGRIVVCGQISEYNGQGAREPGPAWFDILAKRLSLAGFILSDHLDCRDEFIEEVGALYRQGRLRVHEDLRDGLENAPDAFIGMLQGRNLGKMLVRLDRTVDAP